MDRLVLVRNRQRRRRVDTGAVHDWTERLLGEGMGLGGWELGITLVGAPAMARLNWEYLRHEGSTDIITFDHGVGGAGAGLHGECFISVDDAVAQAREFGTRPGEELARYVVHGILHLRGFDDLEPGARRIMKRQENRWVRWLASRTTLGRWLKEPARGGR